MRPFVVAANWKMHKGPAETAEYFKGFLPSIDAMGVAKDPAFRRVVFFVPAIDLVIAQQTLKGTNIAWGAQNCYFEQKGAFTGENSPAVLAELATPFTLVGHSERRSIFKETDDETAKKVRALHQVGITPMLCVGETLEEREAGKTSEVIVRQLEIGLSLRDQTKRVTIAYEPVWAIGTGKVATPEQAGEAHAVLRKALLALGGDVFAESTPILYGGSVKPENANDIAKQEDVDGFLVGGASLEVEPFLSLCQVAKK